MFEDRDVATEAANRKVFLGRRDSRILLMGIAYCGKAIAPITFSDAAYCDASWRRPKLFVRSRSRGAKGGNEVEDRGRVSFEIFSKLHDQPHKISRP